MKTALLIPSIALSMMMCAAARIGDTPEQCLARYHDPKIKREAWSGNNYLNGALETSCAFRDNSCLWIRYSIADASSVRRPDYKDQPHFTAAQVKRLLSLNASGSKWIKEGDDHKGASEHGIYVTEDGKSQAKVMDGFVIVESISPTNEMKKLQETTEIDRVLTEIGAEAKPQIATNAGQWTDPKKQQADAKSDQEMKDLETSVKDVASTLKIIKSVDEVTRNLEELKKENEAAEKAALPPGMNKR